MSRASAILIAVLLAVVTVAAVLVVVNLTPSNETGELENGKIRIVSLAPNVTEMIFTLGLEDQLVGRTTVCDYPQAVEKIERIGDFGEPNMEKLLAIKPDVVIYTDTSDAGLIRAIEAAGIKMLHLEINNFKNMFDAMRQISQAANAPERTEKIIADLEEKLQRVSRGNEGNKNITKPKVYVEISNNPIYSVGGTSFINELIELSGGVNVAREVDCSYPKLSAEKIIEWDPDFILVGYMGKTDDLTEAISGRIGWGNISAIRNGGIICDISHDIFLRPGPRLIDAVEQLSQRIFPASSTMPTSRASEK